MRLRPVVAGLALAGALAGWASGASVADPASGGGSGSGFATGARFGPAPSPVPDGPDMGSSFTLPSALIADDLLAVRGMTRGKREPKRAASGKQGTSADADSAARAAADSAAAVEASTPARPRRFQGLPHARSGERARLMLQSLTLPGWGQATIGRPRAAAAFALLEAAVWGSFTAFRIQEHMRRETYERTARLFGGIDLDGRDEEYRRLVGLYASSDEYNRLVVRRDATNLYFGDPAAYAAYVAAHEVRGDDAWAWGSEADLERYRRERQATQRATKHAHDALAAAVINRLLSVVHAARSASGRPPDQTSWRLECVPVGGDPTAFRLAVRADF